MTLNQVRVKSVFSLRLRHPSLKITYLFYTYQRAIYTLTNTHTSTHHHSKKHMARIQETFEKKTNDWKIGEKNITQSERRLTKCVCNINRGFYCMLHMAKKCRHIFHSITSTSHHFNHCIRYVALRVRERERDWIAFCRITNNDWKIDMLSKEQIAERIQL